MSNLLYFSGKVSKSRLNLNHDLYTWLTLQEGDSGGEPEEQGPRQEVLAQGAPSTRTPGKYRYSRQIQVFKENTGIQGK